jgi:hypothetical protein
MISKRSQRAYKIWIDQEGLQGLKTVIFFPNSFPPYQNFDAAQIATLTNTLLHLTNYESSERHSQIPITSKIVQRIALEHGDTPWSRTIKDVKPKLSADLLDLREQYSVWALQKLEKSAVFVFADYAQIEFGGVPRGKQKVWKPK